MKKFRIEDFTRGWIIGDFEPSLVRTKAFEVAIMRYKKGDKDKAHVHKIADEFTIITKGSVTINGEKYVEGDVIWIEPGDVSEFIPLEDTTTTVVKIPSVIGDKYPVDK